jgi:hypothetical protein
MVNLLESRRKSAKDLSHDSLFAGQPCIPAVLNTKPKCYILDHGVLYTKLYHFTDMATRYIGRSRVAETRKLNSGQGCEWNKTVTNDSSKNSEVRAQLVLVADNGLQRLTEHNYDQHRYNKDASLGHMQR